MTSVKYIIQTPQQQLSVLERNANFQYDPYSEASSDVDGVELY